MKKAILIGSSICLFLLIGAAVLFNILLDNSSKIEKYDFSYLNSESENLLRNFMTEREIKSEILSCHVIIQNNQVFVFFDYKPLEDNPVISEMPMNVIERNLFFGYAKIEKKFNKYNIVDFGVGNYDKAMETKGAGGIGVSRDQRHRYFGKILDNDVDKIEFYDDDILVCTYYVGDKDYYFVELQSNLGNVNYKFYDKENRTLYE